MEEYSVIYGESTDWGNHPYYSVAYCGTKENAIEVAEKWIEKLKKDHRYEHGVAYVLEGFCPLYGGYDCYPPTPEEINLPLIADFSVKFED